MYKQSKEYLASELARLDAMLYRHVANTFHDKFLHEPAGYTMKLFRTYMDMDYEVLDVLYTTKKVVMTIEKM